MSFNDITIHANPPLRKSDIRNGVYTEHMRREPFTVGSYIHVTKRGARGLPITKTNSDRFRFNRILFYMNEIYRDETWERDTHSCGSFERPSHWPERKPLVSVIAWTLMSNHFHLLLKEEREGGVSTFMQRLCGSMTKHYNAKYSERGSLFQGAYHSKTIEDDAYMRYVPAYIMTKNVFEMHPKGYAFAEKNFNEAWQWAMQYPWSSLRYYAGQKQYGAELSPDILAELYSPESFRNFSKEVIVGRAKLPDYLITDV